MFVKSIPQAVKSDGTKIPYEIGKGYNLSIGTWYIDAGLPDAAWISIHCAWDFNLAASSLNYESSNLPAFASLSDPYADSSGAVDVALNASDMAGAWIPWNPSTPYIPTDGAGVTVTNATVAIAGGAQGGATFNIINADRRGRTKIVVTTGGYFRQHTHGKNA